MKITTLYSLTNRAIMKQQMPTRRTILGYTPALLGLGLVSATVKTNDASRSPFDVKNYGATGVRKDNGTKAFSNAIEACTKADGGTVEVPSGEGYGAARQYYLSTW